MFIYIYNIYNIWRKKESGLIAETVPLATLSRFITSSLMRKIEQEDQNRFYVVYDLLCLTTVLQFSCSQQFGSIIKVQVKESF